MSETLLGVIVGGLIVIAGNIVAGLFQRHQTRITLEAQRDQQTRQFQFEKEQRDSQFKFEKEQRDTQFQFESEQKTKEFEFNKDQQIINRIVAERSKWIEPLKASLSGYSLWAIKTGEALVALRIFDFGASYLELLKNSVSEWDKATNKFGTDTTQISDPLLKQLVEDLRSSELHVSLVIYANIDVKTCEDYESQIDKIRDTVSQTFKRIEDLLCGK